MATPPEEPIEDEIPREARIIRLVDPGTQTGREMMAQLFSQLGIPLRFMGPINFTGSLVNPEPEEPPIILEELDINSPSLKNERFLNRAATIVLNQCYQQPFVITYVMVKHKNLSGFIMGENIKLKSKCKANIEDSSDISKVGTYYMCLSKIDKMSRSMSSILMRSKKCDDHDRIPSRVEFWKREIIKDIKTFSKISRRFEPDCKEQIHILNITNLDCYMIICKESIYANNILGPGYRLLREFEDKNSMKILPPLLIESHGEFEEIDDIAKILATGLILKEVSSMKVLPDDPKS